MQISTVLASEIQTVANFQRKTEASDVGKLFTMRLRWVLKVTAVFSSRHTEIIWKLFKQLFGANELLELLDFRRWWPMFCLLKRRSFRFLRMIWCTEVWLVVAILLATWRQCMSYVRRWWALVDWHHSKCLWYDVTWCLLRLHFFLLRTSWSVASVL